MSDRPGRVRSVTVTVNGDTYRREVETRRTLVDFLREDLDITGTHVGCEHGVCGACTVLIDGRSVRSCLMLAVQADGRVIRTVEGLTRPDGTLNALQEAFSAEHALQCGFCTPGMLMTLTEYLEEETDPTDAGIRERISGNLCRCTGYQNIVLAAQSAAAERRRAVCDA